MERLGFLERAREAARRRAEIPEKLRTFKRVHQKVAALLKTHGNEIGLVSRPKLQLNYVVANGIEPSVEVFFTSEGLNPEEEEIEVSFSGIPEHIDINESGLSKIAIWADLDHDYHRDIREATLDEAEEALEIITTVEGHFSLKVPQVRKVVAAN